ncbi:MAG: lipid II flippase MurJ, partial [Bilophila sp.]
ERKAHGATLGCLEAQVGAVLRRLPAGILGAAVPQLAFLVASTLASQLSAGHISALFYAERLLEFPLGVLGAAVGIVAAPRLAVLASSSSSSSEHPLAHETGLAVALALGLTLPAAAGLMAVAVPLVALVLGHGAFDSASVTRTALALCAYAPGLPAYALSRPLLAACHALEDTRTPLFAAVPSLLLTAFAGYALMQLPGDWGQLGPPLGVTLGLWCNAVLLWLGVRHAVLFTVPYRSVLVQLFGTACTFCTAQFVVTSCASHNLSHVTTLALAVPLGALAYGLVFALCSRQHLPARKDRRTARRG